MGVEAQVAQRRMAYQISKKMKQKYSKMCRFLCSSISLEIVISKTSILSGTWDKSAQIWQRMEPMYSMLLCLLET